MRRRIKTRKDAVVEPVVLDPALAFDGIGARQLPPVLTVDVVMKGLMPPLGVSALPPTLESAIPPEYRYWTAKSLEEARAARDELVERALIEPVNVLKVDGELRRVIWRAFLAEEDAEPTALAKRTDVALAGAMKLLPTEEPIHAFAGDANDVAPWTVDRIAKMVSNIGERVCIALSDTPEHRIAIASLKSAFVVKTRPGVVYGSPLPLDPEAAHVEPAPPPSIEKSHTVRMIRKADAEERFVFGIVLEPDVIDSQNDTYSAEEVRKAAHGFMEKHAQLGQQHSAIVTGKLKILESYVAPVDFSIGEEAVKAGTWMLAIRVVDDGLWSMMKAGSFTGFSIGGTAIRQPA